MNDLSHLRRGRAIVGAADDERASDPNNKRAQVEALSKMPYNCEIRDLPVRYRLLKITVPDDARVQRVSSDDLHRDWLETTQATRATGDAWLAQGSTALLTVPSAIVPETLHVLLNPAHPDAARIVIVQATDHVIDPRLLA